MAFEDLTRVLSAQKRCIVSKVLSVRDLGRNRDVEPRTACEKRPPSLAGPASPEHSAAITFVTAFLVALVALSSVPLIASAQVDTVDPDQLTETLRSDATYGNGNQPMPCNPTCQVVRQAERQPIQNPSLRTRFMSQLYKLRERVRLWQPLQNARTLYMTPGLGQLTVVAILGYDVNRRWIKLGWSTPAAGSSEEHFSNPRMIWSEQTRVADANPPSGGGDLILPADAWHLAFNWSPGTSDLFRWLAYDDAQCNYADFPAPQGWTVVTAPRPQSCFIEWNPFPNAVYADGQARAAYTQDLHVIGWGDGIPPDGQYDHNIPGGGQDANSFEEDQTEILSQLDDHPGDYDLLLPWLEYMLSGKANQTDPLGNGEQDPDIDFKRYQDKWEKHVIDKDEFPGEGYEADPKSTGATPRISLSVAVAVAKESIPALGRSTAPRSSGTTPGRRSSS